MTTTASTATIAAVLFILFTGYVAVTGKAYRQKVWLLPATLSLIFLLFSLETIAAEGLLGFWYEHSARNLWGNQIWIDLLLAIGIGWSLIVPQAKAVGMRTLPWLILIICSGSIGFLAMVARLSYLKGQKEQSPYPLSDRSLT